MFNCCGCSPTVTNCTFSGNTAGAGAAIWSQDNDEGHTVTTTENCILWGDSPEPIANFDGGDTHVRFGNVRGGWPGDGNINAAPLFVREGYWDDSGTPDDPRDDVWVHGDSRLLPDSPCINTGDPTPNGLDPTDLDGHPRVLCGIVDMGAYEFGVGDFDCDRVVDLTDFAAWYGCMTGPTGNTYPTGCEAFDFNANGAIDLSDFAAIQSILTQ